MLFYERRTHNSSLITIILVLFFYRTRIKKFQLHQEMFKAHSNQHSHLRSITLSYGTLKLEFRRRERRTKEGHLGLSHTASCRHVGKALTSREGSVKTIISHFSTRLVFSIFSLQLGTSTHNCLYLGLSF